MLEKREKRAFGGFIFFGLEVNQVGERGGIDQKRIGFWSLLVSSFAWLLYVVDQYIIIYACTTSMINIIQCRTISCVFPSRQSKVYQKNRARQYRRQLLVYNSLLERHIKASVCLAHQFVCIHVPLSLKTYHYPCPNPRAPSILVNPVLCGKSKTIRARVNRATKIRKKRIPRGARFRHVCHARPAG